MFHIYLDSISSSHVCESHVCPSDYIGYIDVMSGDTFNINSLFVYEKFRGKGYGKYILEYALEYVKKIYPNIEYCMLDDVSDRSNHVYGNIYQQLGFNFVEKPTKTFVEDGILKWKISGPERIKKI